VLLSIASVHVHRCVYMLAPLYMFLAIVAVPSVPACEQACLLLQFMVALSVLQGVVYGVRTEETVAHPALINRWARWRLILHTVAPPRAVHVLVLPGSGAAGH
jgi:hypothetical protein